MYSPCPAWKKIPFLRPLLFLVLGIISQWYLSPGHTFLIALIAVSGLIICSLYFFPIEYRYKFSQLDAFAHFSLCFALGGFLILNKQPQHIPSNLLNHYREGDTLVGFVEKPPVEKPSTFKTQLRITAIYRRNRDVPVNGIVMAYLKKKHFVKPPVQGQQVYLCKPLESIRSAGNPGAFDYRQYAYFQGFHYQVFPDSTNCRFLESVTHRRIPDYLNTCRTSVLSLLRKYIRGELECGLAEALLIGYKDDLDKKLVRSYANTGVVHIIAISGLHLGLIYWLLVLMLRPVSKLKSLRWLRLLLILSGLWIFTLLAGAQPSILRAAIMFTFIAISENISRKPNILNSLASSAFVLLCLNPFWLWDIGFQLSYTAVLSIILFMKPVYACLYLPNRALDLVWQMVAVTIAAQLLTFPLCIYYFHQFPTYFILTNLVAIPLSTLILFAEILLCGLSFFPFAAMLVGELITAGIRIMNAWIRNIEMIPGALLDGINCSIAQVILVFGLIMTVQYGIIKRKITAIKFSLLFLLLFFIFRSYSFYQAMRQQLMIVYNVPGKQAIDLISSRQYLFRGDPNMAINPDERDFYLKATRTHYRTRSASSLPNINKSRDHFLFNKTKIWIPTARTLHQSAVKNPQVVDICIISGKYRGSIARLTNGYRIKQLIFDSSTRPWQMAAWKKECEEQKINYYDVREEGAFVINIP